MVNKKVNKTMKAKEGRRIAGRSNTEEVKKWLDSQSNLNTSLNNVITHMVRIFGYCDIMDYNIQEFLFHKIATTKPFVAEEKGEYRVDFKVNTVFTGLRDNKNSKMLEDMILSSDDDFKLIIDKSGCYYDAVNELGDKGYKIISVLNEKDNEPLSSTNQIKEVLEHNNLVEKKKVVHIHTDENYNGFDIEQASLLLEKVFLQTKESGIKARYYIDEHVPFFNQLPIELCSKGRAYNHLVFAVLEKTIDIKEDLLPQFYIQNLKNDIFI